MSKVPVVLMSVFIPLAGMVAACQHKVQTGWRAPDRVVRSEDALFRITRQPGDVRIFQSLTPEEARSLSSAFENVSDKSREAVVIGYANSDCKRIQAKITSINLKLESAGSFSVECKGTTADGRHLIDSISHDVGAAPQ